MNAITFDVAVSAAPAARCRRRRTATMRPRITTARGGVSPANLVEIEAKAATDKDKILYEREGGLQEGGLQASKQACRRCLPEAAEKNEGEGV
jgi:hypothetical protein